MPAPADAGYRTPYSLTEFLAVRILLFGEAGATITKAPNHSSIVRSLGAMMLLSAVSLSVELVAHSIVTYQGDRGQFSQFSLAAG